jgi:hypothetical protein
LNRLGLYKNPKVLKLGKSLVNSGGICSEAAAIPSISSMPSNERRVHQNGGSQDVGNFKTTLVLHLKEKESIPRNNKSLRLEKTEKLIGKKYTIHKYNETGNSLIVLTSVENYKSSYKTKPSGI